jgi:hypothetical protein
MLMILIMILIDHGMACGGEDQDHEQDQEHRLLLTSDL